jgi:polyhydroxybutyrate depolymerase
MRSGFLVYLALAVACSDAGSSDAMPMIGTTTGAGANGGPAGTAAMSPSPAASSAGAGNSGTPMASGSGGRAAATAGGAASDKPAMPASAGSAAEAGSGTEVPVAGNSGAGGTPAGAGPAEPEEPQTCSAAGSPGRSVEMVENAGVTRSFILHVPDSYTGEQPVPLVVYYHPLLTNAATAEGSSMYRELADREGFIVAFPDGQESAAWNVGPCCTQSREVDDVGFTRALVAHVQSNYCVDKKRIYASGFSMGGGMAHYLGCEAADLFAAVAPGAFDLLAENTCAPARPITMISFRSMSDTIVPYAGGVKQNAPNGFVGEHTFLGAVPTFERWAEIDGCTDQPVDEGGGCQTHKQCAEGVEVTLCTVPGGHTWPDAERSWQTLSRFTLP